MIHGRTEIVLTDVNNGKVKKVCSENVFQGQFIAKYLRSLGSNSVIQFPKKNTDLFPLWKEVVGGLFLFRDAIDINNGSVQYMPAGNSMVGVGVVGMTHTGDPTEWGSFNANESSAGLSSITQVYDFSTDQANGNISCVSLTSRLGAQIGYGHNGDSYLGHYSNEPVAYNGELVYPNGWCFKDSNNKEWYLTIRDTNASSYYNIYNGVLYLKKYRYGIDKVSLFNLMEKSIAKDLTDMSNPLNITSSCYGYISMFPIGGTLFRFIPSVSGGGSNPTSIPASGTVPYYEFNAETEALTVSSFINPLTEAIYYNGSNGNSTIAFTKDNCVIVRGYTSRKLFKISLAGIIIKEFDNEIDFSGNYASPANGCYGQNIVPGLQLFNSKQSISSNQNVFVYDTVANTVKRINIHYNTRNCYNSELDICEYNMAAYSGGGLDGGYFAQTNPLYLATINNLETPVTKTAAQTMKVTYTLTEV